MKTAREKWGRLASWLAPTLAFAAVFALHAFYVVHSAPAPVSDGWADIGLERLGPWDFYLKGQEYFVGFSYALGAAYAAWSLGEFLRVRQAAMAAGTITSLTLTGALMAFGCFMTGCCGSPMLGVYASMFGASALGVGKPLMAGVSLLSVLGGVWYLRRKRRSACPRCRTC